MQHSLTLFQEECERRLVSALPAGLEFTDREVKGSKERYVYAKIPSRNIEIWLYVDEAMFTAAGKSFVYERPDYPDVEKRIAVFVAAIVACVAGEEPTDKGSARVSLFRGRKI
jgi:hypothetical protein